MAGEAVPCGAGSAPRRVPGPSAQRSSLAGWGSRWGGGVGARASPAPSPFHGWQIRTLYGQEQTPICPLSSVRICLIYNRKGLLITCKLGPRI